MTGPDPIAVPDRTRALERQHEEIEALLRDEVELLRQAQADRYEEIALLSRRLAPQDRRAAVEAALRRWRLKCGAGGPPPGLPPLDRQVAAIEGSPLLDAEGYRRALPAEMAPQVSPARHYVETGAFEGLDPGPDFSTLAYYALNPDVLEAGWPALSHYLLHGAGEGRLTRPAGDDGTGDG